MSIVPSVVLNPEDGQWMEMLQELRDKSMKNKCYYVIIKQDDIGNKIIDLELDRGYIKYF